MGRKLRGAKLRAEKRGKVAAEELVATKATETEAQEVTQLKDDDLFVLDTRGSVMSSKKQEKSKKRKKESVSAFEAMKIEKLVATHSVQQLQALSAQGNRTSKRARLSSQRSVKAHYDLWDDDKNNNAKASTAGSGVGSMLPAGVKPPEHVKITSTRALAPTPTTKLLSLQVAQSGQSYNPDKHQHKQVIQKAVQVETNRQLAEDLRKAPISTGMTAATRALLVGDSDSDISSDDDDRDENNNNNNNNRTTTVGPILEKRKEKYTRAQRNKQKRVREEQRLIDERKRQKRLQNSISEAKTISKKMRKKANEKEKEKELKKQLKEESIRVKGEDVYQQLAKDNPIHAPTYPVALTDELQEGSSLRTLKPKGSLITDRMTSLQDRDMAAKKQLKRRKRMEGKRRKLKLKVKGKGFKESREEGILG